MRRRRILRRRFFAMRPNALERERGLVFKAIPFDDGVKLYLRVCMVRLSNACAGDGSCGAPFLPDAFALHHDSAGSKIRPSIDSGRLASTRDGKSTAFSGSSDTRHSRNFRTNNLQRHDEDRIDIIDGITFRCVSLDNLK